MSKTPAIAIAPLLIHLLCASAGAEDTTLDRIVNAYESIKTVTCSVRKTSKAGSQTVRMLSRVHYKSNGYIHVENVSPSKRRIIADGKSLYYHDSNAKKGYSSPIAELDDTWAASLNTVPASPMDHLSKMKTMKQLKSSQHEGGQSLIFGGDKNHVRMTIDAKGRISTLEFFSDITLNDRYAVYKYSDFLKAGDAWLARRHEAEITLPDETKATEVRIFENLAVNTIIPDKLFDHKIFMKKVEFVPDFEDTWK